MPSATNNPAMANIMVSTSTPSPAKMCKRWGLPCPFCAQSTQHPSPVDSNWSEEDWDGQIEKDREKKETRGDGAKARRRRKKNLDSNYYPPSSMYVPSYEEEPPALLRDLIPTTNPRDVKNSNIL